MTDTAHAETIYYLDDYAEETVPCECTLAGWAAWLSKPDPDWNRTTAAQDGDIFSAFTLELLGDVRAEYIDGEWRAVTPIPEDTEFFYQRDHEGSRGWQADLSGSSIAEAAAATEDERDEPLWFACLKDGQALHLMYRAAGPTLDIVRPS